MAWKYFSVLYHVAPAPLFLKVPLHLLIFDITFSCVEWLSLYLYPSWLVFLLSQLSPTFSHCLSSLSQSEASQEKGYSSLPSFLVSPCESVLADA
jgi:hypothetical protein